MKNKLRYFILTIICISLVIGAFNIVSTAKEATKPGQKDKTTFINSNAEPKKILRVRNYNLNLEFKESDSAYSTSNKVDKYENKEYTALYRLNKNECIGITHKSPELLSNISREKIESDKAKQIADEILSDIIGQDAFKMYDCVSNWYNEADSIFRIAYVTKINNYLSDDLSMVGLYKDGTLVFASAIYNNKYKGVKYPNLLKEYESVIDDKIKEAKNKYGEWSFLSEPFLSFNEDNQLIFKEKNLKTGKMEMVTLNQETDKRKIVLSAAFKKSSSKVSFKLVNGIKNRPLLYVKCTINYIDGKKKCNRIVSVKKNNITKFDVKTNLKNKQTILNIKIQANFKHPNPNFKGWDTKNFTFMPSK